MNERRRDIRTTYALPMMLMLCVACGCSMVREVRENHKPLLPHQRATSSDVVDRGFVTVGGQVRFPQQLELPAEGLDLRTAVQICGGAAQGSDASVQFVGGTVAESSEPSTTAARRAVTNRLTEATASGNDLLTRALEDVSRMIDGGTSPVDALVEVTRSVRSTTPNAANRVVTLAELEDLQDVILNLAPATTPRPAVVGAPALRTSAVLVALDRGTGLTQSTHHFLLDSLLAGQVGPIALAAGDRVSLLPMEHTHFGQSSGRDGEVTMVGAVKKDRNRTVGGSPINTSTTDAFIQGRIPIAAAAMQIERVKPNGVGKDFLVVPLGRAQSSEFANYEFHGEDVVTLAPVALLPIVRDSILQPVIAQRVRARTEEAMAKVEQRQEALLKRTANESMLDRTTRRFRRLGTFITNPPSLATLR